MAIQLLSEATSKFTTILFGNSGVGKTTFAATAQLNPKMADVLFLDFDKRLSPVVDTPGLLVAVVNNSIDAELIITALRNRDEGYETVRTVVIDSLTRWIDREKQILGLAGLERKRKGQFSRDELQWKDYGILTMGITRLVGDLIDIPDLHVIMNSHKRVFYKDDKQVAVRKRTFNAHESLENSLANMFNNNWALSRENGTIRMLTQPEKQYVCKTSGNSFPVRLGDVVEIVGRRDDDDRLVLEPNLSTIFDLYIESEYGE